MKNWDLIVAVLFHSGSCNRILDGAARNRVWAQGDGYGRMDLDQLRELELLGDWSHIRDSSDEGQERIVKQIRAELCRMDRERAARFPELPASPNHHERVVKDVVAKLGARV